MSGAAQCPEGTAVWGARGRPRGRTARAPRRGWSGAARSSEPVAPTGLAGAPGAAVGPGLGARRLERGGALPAQSLAARFCSLGAGCRWTFPIPAARPVRVRLRSGISSSSGRPRFPSDLFPRPPTPESSRSPLRAAVAFCGKPRSVLPSRSLQELFVQHLAACSYRRGSGRERKALTYADLSKTAEEAETFQFLADILPKKILASKYLKMLKEKRVEDEEENDSGDGNDGHEAES
ncbi:chromatin accessibility complex protein 1 isoform X1 [Mustela putorius furo]|uniref:Chromatin accessibility complex protein 1 isoform X1 n=2 Tax=Mustela putorius furo TaxID=9669 RepID=A0A8U0S143_MUSPF|nr:chromatin accessibility complex protein 1 isoform X1 [Mustela putorius furo]